ncbi:MAG: hypothetical protein JOZ51_08265 [Chloroflexi bacterium]|nr:hypothetical protein [Chloroflexota bacterium]
MHRRSTILLVIVIGVSLLMATNLWGRQARPDWIALYEQKLGRPIEEIEEAPLIARLEADGWDDPRITKVRLKDGTMLLLGLPQDNPFSAKDIIENSVVLDVADAEQRCYEELEIRDFAGGWSGLDSEQTNTYVIRASSWLETTDETTGERTSISSPTDPYCELEFTYQWQLSVVKPVGVIAAVP